MSSILNRNTKLIKDEAFRLGFSFFGVSKAAFMEEEAWRLETCLHQGKHGNMGYI